MGNTVDTSLPSGPFVADYTLASEARRAAVQERENLWADFSGRARRDLFHVGPHPMGCEESTTTLPAEPWGSAWGSCQDDDF